MVYCRACGKELHKTAVACTACGAQQDAVWPASDKKILPAVLLCFFVGIFGVHRFYVGKIGTGILQMITLGGFGIWYIIDLILLACGEFKDKQNRKLTQWRWGEYFFMKFRTSTSKFHDIMTSMV